MLKQNTSSAARPARSEQLLIQFAKLPLLGQVKTRMQPHLTPEQSRDLHQQLVEHNLARLARSDGYDFQLAIAGEPDAYSTKVLNDWLSGFELDYFVQEGRDLGARMAHAVRQGFAQGYSKVIIIGSDCPFIDSSVVDKAFAALASKPIVLVPALDGGYVLIAQQAYYAWAFEGIEWGSERVLEQTLDKACQNGIDISLQSPLADIDRPEDLALLPQHIALKRGL